jgi:hypothetical protein
MKTNDHCHLSSNPLPPKEDPDTEPQDPTPEDAPVLPEIPVRKEPLPEFFPLPNHPQTHPTQKKEKGIWDRKATGYGILGKQIVFVFLMLLFFTGIQAQTLPLGPHQGRTVATGGYVIEMLGCMDHLEVYVYEKDMQFISNVRLSGEAQFYGWQKTIFTPLVPYGRDGFTAKLPTYNFASCKIGINIKDIRINAEFTNECTITH